MVIKDIPALQLANSPFANHPLLNRHLETLTSLEIGAFVRAAKFDNYEAEALAVVRELTNAAHRALSTGKISAAPFIEFALRKVDTFTIEELIRMLAKTSLVRRQAILFCLETGMHPRQAITLTWKQVRDMHFSDLANDIVDAMPRHIRLPYVFWEVLESGTVAPLFALVETAEDISGTDWNNLTLLYSNMVLIDSSADKDDLIEEVIDVYSKTL